MYNQVKGYIFEMAVILEDEDERISNLAKLFFTELAKKGKLVKLGLILLIRVVQNMAMGGRVMMNKTPKLELVGKLVKDSRTWWRGFVSTTPSPRMIEQLKIDYLSAKIEVEEEIGAPETPPNYLERCMSRDLGVLKDLLKDYKNLNKKISKDVRRKKVAEFKTEEQKRKDIHLPLIGFGPPLFTAHHPQAADIATRIVQSYNRQQNSNFELRRVVDVVQDRYPLDSHFLVEACDRDASSVTIKLQAIYRTCGKEIRQLHAPQPVPFMKLLQSNKTTALSFDERQTLLYANVTNCPIIAKRLGLKGRDELHHELLSRLGINFSTLPLLEQDVDETFVPFKASSISVVKLSLDDLILPSLAHFAVNEWNETQGSLHIRFSRVVGAWREYMMADRYIYHLMIEALDNGVKRRFYSAFVPEPNLDDVELVDWVSTDFRNTITIN